MKIVFTASGRCASAVVEPAGQPITAGSRGVPAEIHLSPDYDGLVVTAFFRSEYGAWPVVLGETPGTVTIPWEAMEKKSLTFDVGVVGKNGDGTIVIPTIWARAGKIVPATEDSGLEPGDPSADIGAQIVEQARAAAKKAEDAAEAAEEARDKMPRIVDGTWRVYNAVTESWEDTGIQAEGQDGVGISDAILNADYTLTLTFSDGTSYTTPPIRGRQGEPGPIGPTPDISIGTVTTGAAGSQADATMTGTPERPVLNLTIPRGDPGEVTQAEFDELEDEVSQQKSVIDGKQDAPADSGTAGQVLGLDDDLTPVWLDQTGGGGGGTTNYNNLTNKPRINGWLLTGDKSAADLGLAAASDIPTVPVQSVNGETGAVVLDASDVGAVAEPQTAGTAGQVLGLDSNLNPVWVNQSGGGGTANYNDLSNKPQIEGVTLSGNKTAADLGLAKASDIPAVPVQSVNGKTGAVALNASDVGALPDSTAIPSKTSDLTNDSGFVNAAGAAAAAPVQSVNGKTGAVVLTASDVGAKPSSYEAPVSSVNSKTGAVVLSASDVGALPSSTSIPSKTSDLTNDSGFVNAAGAAAAAPVQSVNGKTGAVTVQSTITASGILKGAGSGSISAATLGTDYGALAFTVTLTAAGWSSNTQTVNNANFVASGYGYIVSPASGSFADYASAQIYADDVTVAGQMTFHCTTAPSAALTVNILRVVSV